MGNGNETQIYMLMLEPGVYITPKIFTFCIDQ